MPRPQIQRSEWLCLDGEWDYKEDPEAIGLNQKWFDGLDTNDRIQVPFPPGAELSGQPFSSSKVVWFEKTFIAPDWDTEEILLTLVRQTTGPIFGSTDILWDPIQGDTHPLPVSSNMPCETVKTEWLSVAKTL